MLTTTLIADHISRAKFLKKETIKQNKEWGKLFRQWYNERDLPKMNKVYELITGNKPRGKKYIRFIVTNITPRFFGMHQKGMKPMFVVRISGWWINENSGRIEKFKNHNVYGVMNKDSFTISKNQHITNADKTKIREIGKT